MATLSGHSANATDSCPCGLPASTAACCGRYHAGEAAPTPEALMRSRYSAYVLGLADYLLATWHRSTRPASLDFADSPRWLGLSVKRVVPGDALPPSSRVLGTALENQGAVEFVARYKVGGRAHRLHEVSRFVREDGRWYYLDGEIE